MHIRYRTLFTSKSGLEYLSLNSDGIDFLSVQGSASSSDRMRRIYASGQRLFNADPDYALKPVSCVCNEHSTNAVFQGELGGALREFLTHAPSVLQYAEGKRIGRILKAYHDQPISDKQKTRAKERQEHFLERLAQYIGELPHFAGDSKAIEAISKRFGSYDCYRACMRYGQLRHDRIYVRSDLTPVLLPSSTCAPGDICEDFALMECHSAGVYPLYCAGVIDGYFQGEVSPEFFVSFALQCALYSLWHCGKEAKLSDESFGRMQKTYAQILMDFDNFNDCVPRWYQTRELQAVREQARKQGM